MSNLLLDQEGIAASIGEAVKQARGDLGWSIKDTAEHLNISASLYSRIEAGKKLPDTLMLANLVCVLRVDANVALGDKDELSHRVRRASVGQREVVGLFFQAIDDKPPKQAA